MWEKALEVLRSSGWADGSISSETNLALSRLFDDSSIARMKREAIINAARIQGDAHLARVGKAFPSVDFPALIQALRVKVAVMRLEGRL